MKKFLFFLITALFSSCSCLIGQPPPTQYLHVDTTCGAALPDYRPLLHWRDNCGIDTVEQTPSVGTWLTQRYNTVLIRAIDNFDNYTDVLIPVELIDTIPPQLVGVDSTLVSAAYNFIDSLYDIAERILARQTWYEEATAPDSLWTDDDFCNSTLLTWTDPCKAFTGEGFRVWTLINPADTVIIQRR